MKRFLSVGQEIQKYPETMGNRGSQCEDRTSHVEDSDSLSEKVLKGTFKATGNREKWTQQLLDEPMNNGLRVTGIHEK